MTATDTVDLHVSIHPAVGLRLDEELASKMIDIIRDGDSWEDWGTPLEEDDVVPQHVIFRVDTRARAFAILAVIHDHLVPMTYPHQRGVVAVITDSSDWDENVLTIVDADAARQVETLTFVRNVNPHRLWNNRAWQQYIVSRHTEEG